MHQSGGGQLMFFRMMLDRIASLAQRFGPEGATEAPPHTRGSTEVLALATELRKDTIDRIMAMSDLELGLQALLGTLPPGRA